jgi:hypothetical protein
MEILAGLTWTRRIGHLAMLRLEAGVSWGGIQIASIVGDSSKLDRHVA